MDVSVLGFGGSEIGYQRVSAKAVARLLGGALERGLNVIDTAECYEDSEARRKAWARGRRDVYLFSKCGSAARDAVETGRTRGCARSLRESAANGGSAPRCLPLPSAHLAEEIDVAATRARAFPTSSSLSLVTLGGVDHVEAASSARRGAAPPPSRSLAGSRSPSRDPSTLKSMSVCHAPPFHRLILHPSRTHARVLPRRIPPWLRPRAVRRRLRRVLESDPGRKGGRRYAPRPDMLKDKAFTDAHLGDETPSARSSTKTPSSLLHPRPRLQGRQGE